MSQRNLEQWLSYLEQLHPTEIDLGLARIQRVAQRLGVGKPAPKVVTVTGTNGKGSTCAFIAQLLMAQGLQVGVYSSPHLLQYNERVTIQGQPVSDAQLCAAFTAIEQARAEESLTYFEFGTLAALWVFAQPKLEVVVLEVGLGGRLDAVNIVDADVALITSIALDHSDWLGDTRDSVAKEKSGIFRAQQIALCADLDPPAIIEATAQQVGATLLQRDVDFGYLAPTANAWSMWGQAAKGDYRFTELPEVSLPKANLVLAVQAVFSLGFTISKEQLLQSLVQFKMPGRVETRLINWHGKQLQLILDVGHNPLAAEFLAQHLAQRPITGQRYALFGLLKDKDLAGVIDPLLSAIDQWHVVTLPCGRTQQAEVLAAYLQHKEAKVTVETTVEQGLLQLFEKMQAQDQLLIFGSFYTVAAAAKALHALSR